MHSNTLIQLPNLIWIYLTIFGRSVRPIQKMKQYQQDLLKQWNQHIRRYQKKQGMRLVRIQKIFIEIHDDAIRERNNCIQKFNNAKQTNNDLQMNNLTERINRKSFQIKEQKKKITEFQYDIKMISLTFGLPLNANNQQISIINQQPQPIPASPQQIYQINKSTFPQQQNLDIQQNLHLKILFWLVITFFILEFFIQIKHTNFLNTVVGLLLISIFYLDYFDKIYRKFLLGVVAISIIFDLVWIFTKISNWWNPNQGSVHSSLNIGFLRFIMVMLFFVLIIKIVMVWILYKLGKQTQNNIYLIKVWDYKIKIKMNRHHPLRNLLISNDQNN